MDSNYLFGIFWGSNSASHSLAIDQILVASYVDSVSACPAWLRLKLPLTVQKITLYAKILSLRN